MSEETTFSSNSVSVTVHVNLNTSDLYSEDRRFRVVLVINGSILGDEFNTTDALEAIQKYNTWCERWGIKPD